jgi:hypothetical protein
MAWTMNSIPSASARPTSSRPTTAVSPDQHDEITDLEHTNRVTVSTEHVIVLDPVLAGARQHHRIHGVNLP